MRDGKGWNGKEEKSNWRGKASKQATYLLASKVLIPN